MLSIPTISVGMPVYNCERYLKEAIESILNQSFRDFELIISDNASTDKTEDICKQYANIDNRIIYIKQKENIGAIENFKFVLSKAKASYFIWVAGDDSNRSDFFEKLYFQFQTSPELICVMSDVENIGIKNFYSKLDTVRINNKIEDWIFKRKIFFKLKSSNLYFIFYGLYKIDYLKKVQLNYKNKVRYLSNSEIPFLAQLVLLGRVGSIPESLKIYRRHTLSSYYSEVSKFNLINRIYKMININLILIEIIWFSEIALKEKAPLYLECLKNFLRPIYNRIYLWLSSLKISSNLILF